MKILISHSSGSEDYLWINNLDSLDIIVDEGEAKEIIVDDFLSSFYEKDLYSVLTRIVSKIAKGGKFILYFTDLELLASKLSMGYLTASDFNEIIFSNGPNVKSLLNSDSILDFLAKLNINIDTKQIKNGYTSIITGTYK